MCCFFTLFSLRICDDIVEVVLSNLCKPSLLVALLVALPNITLLTTRVSEFIASFSFLNSSKPKAANKLKSGSSPRAAAIFQDMKMYGFTGTINHRFLTNQSALSISVIL